jgi:hypothetical protein
MSNHDTRVAIAAALDTVQGLTGTPRRPKLVTAGAAWPQWGGSERADGGAFLVTWNILVVLPAQEQDADEFVDDRLDDLYDAIQPVAHITGYQPAQLQTSEGDLYALMITARSE